MTTVLQIDALSHTLGDFKLDVTALALNPGESLLVLGPSGSGKSTLLNLITGVLPLQSGSIGIGGQPLGGLSARARDRLRGESMGIIYQSLNLLPFISAVDNVRAALAFAPNRRHRTASDAAEQLLTAVGLSAAQQRLRTGALSVGQQQRVAIARALIGAPALIIADEPTSALDRRNRDAFLDLLFGQIQSPADTGAHGGQQALLMVSHDEAIASHFDRVVTMAELARP